MSDHEVRGRAVYDHRDEEPRPARGLYAIADARSEDEPRPARRRRQVADWGVGDEVFDHMPGQRFARDRRGAERRIPRGGVEDGRRTIVIEHDGAEPPFEPPVTPDETFASREEALRAHGGVEGRRTVKIVGRPGEFYPPSERRRPARTAHERVGPRPDRIAAWACALGLLLIIIAIATT